MRRRTKKLLKRLVLVVPSAVIVFYISWAAYLVHNGLPSTHYSANAGKVYTSNAIGNDDEKYVVSTIPFTMRNGHEAKRVVIKLKDLPPQVRQRLIEGLIAVEDQQFYYHLGWNPLRFLVALIKDIASLSFKEGASTITQQLVKNAYLSGSKSIHRKLLEIFVAIVLELSCSKEDILEMYINEAPLGQDGNFAVIGFGQAALSHCKTKLDEISLQDLAMLIRMLKANTPYSPGHEKCKEGRDLVLDIMATTVVSGDKTVISRAEAEAAKKEPTPQPKKRPIGWNVDQYAVQHGLHEVERSFGSKIDLANSNVYLTTDSRFMDASRFAIKTVLPTLKAKKCGKSQLQVAMVAMDVNTGAILSEVGGRSLDGMNRSVESSFPPGSTFKPIAMSAAIEEKGSGILLQEYMNAPLDQIPGYTLDYKPANFADSYSRQMTTAREGLVHSLNVTMLQVAALVGRDPVMQLAERAGIPQQERVWSMFLGTLKQTPLDMASAYTSLATDGSRVVPHILRRITDKKGSVVFDWEPKGDKVYVMKPQTAHLVTDVLRDVVKRGTAKSIGDALPQFPLIAAKTGTASNLRHGVFVAYTPKFVVYIWVGYDSGCDLGLTGGASAGEIFKAFAKRLAISCPECFTGEFGTSDPIEPLGVPTPEKDEVDMTTSGEPEATQGETKVEESMAAGKDETKVETPTQMPSPTPTPTVVPKPSPDPKPSLTASPKATPDDAGRPVLRRAQPSPTATATPTPSSEGRPALKHPPTPKP